MWKYIVTYIIIKTITVACSEAPLEVDEFGRVKSPGMTLDIICTEDDTTYMERVFDSKKEAVMFIKKGQDRKAQGWEPRNGLGELSLFKLDSVPLVQYNCYHINGTVTTANCPDWIKCNTFTCSACGKRIPEY